MPESYTEDKEYSFLLFLHGAGNRGNDNENQISQNVGLLQRIIGGEEIENNGEIIDPSQEFIIVAPQCEKDFQWVDTPWDKTPDPSYNLSEVKQSAYMTAVEELVTDIQKNYSLNDERMYISGLSMGGFGTWDYLMRRPDFWAAAIPMGGGGDPEQAESIKDIPIWTFHQYYDPVVSSEGTLNMTEAMVQAGSNIKFTGYFDLQHNAWTKGFAEKDLLSWLYSNKKTKIKVACVGDSITEGAGLENPEQDSYPAVLGELLGGNYEVQNFGKSACSALSTAVYPYTETEQYLASLEYNPDILFIMLGTNDIKYENWDNGKYDFEDDFLGIINSYKNVNPELKIFVGIPPAILKENVYGERSPEILEKEGIPQIYSVAQKAGAEIVNLFNLSIENPEMYPDFLHPNKEGAKALANTISEKIIDVEKTNETKNVFSASEWALRETTIMKALGYSTEIINTDLQDEISVEEAKQLLKNVFDISLNEVGITRGEIAKQLSDIINKNVDGNITFTDIDNTSKDIAEAISNLADCNVISGYGDGSFRPNDNATREEMIALCYRAMHAINKSD